MRRRARRHRGRHRDEIRIASRVRFPALLLLLAVVYGTVGYTLIEGFGLIDSVYMAVITLTTVGFGEVRPLGPAGRVFTITLILFGIVAVFDLIGVLTTLLASGELGRALERRGMRRSIEGLHDHYVICAYGRVGRAAAQELLSHGAEVLVIESQAELEPLLAEAGLPYLIDDPTQEAVLEEAGIGRAKGLLCAVDSDAVNVYITLTARALNPSLFIISRASSRESIETLMRAGSDRVVSPYQISGVRMAGLALRPAVLEFVDMLSVAPDLRIEELVIGERSRLADRTVKDACSPYGGVMLLAVKRRDGELLFPPLADTVLCRGDLVIAAGRANSLAGLADDAR